LSKFNVGNSLIRVVVLGMGFAETIYDCSLKTESSKSVDRFPVLFYNRNVKWILTSILVLSMAVPAVSQYDTADDSLYSDVIIPRPELRWIMDTPTAGILPRGAFDMDMRTFPVGGVQTTLNIGLGHRFSVGIGYGASEILTDKDPDWNPQIEFLLRFRLHEESEAMPAIAVGFSSIGFGKYDTDNNRYQVKSPGFYIVFSKNLLFYENLATWHAGLNLSLENEHDSDPNFFVGFSADVGTNMTFLAEYDLALNDNSGEFALNDIGEEVKYGKKRGYLNLGLAWYITQELSLELDLKNLFRNRDDADAIDREIRLVYTEYFY